MYSVLRYIFKTGLELAIKVALLMGSSWYFPKNLDLVNALNLCYNNI